MIAAGAGWSQGAGRQAGPTRDVIRWVPSCRASGSRPALLRAERQTPNYGVAGARQ